MTIMSRNFQNTYEIIQIRLICLALVLTIAGLPSLAPAGQGPPGKRGQTAMRMMEQDKIYFYFPVEQTRLAQRLAAECDIITSFLASRGLPPGKPLHIILDDGLDAPQVRVRMVPHLEIRIPLRAPGVLEDGFWEPDPWRYFLFLGLSRQGIFAERSRIPEGLHYVFGEGVSPNVILPEWAIDGISHLLYEEFARRSTVSPLDRSIMLSSPIPELDKVSNHPEIWPGRASFRIYGRPFIRWLNEQYGWEKIHAFLRVHGGGIIPIEIDGKVRKVFGRTPAQLWNLFRNEVPIPAGNDNGGAPPLPLAGFWPDPLVYWNHNGVFPGLMKNAARGRYGYMDDHGWLWLSRYTNGVSRLTCERGDTLYTSSRRHVWDPGPGAVAVTRKGRHPYLVLNLPPVNGVARSRPGVDPLPPERLIPGPPGVIQLSGPVADDDGRVAVAGNTGGNWDIWLYDGQWHRVTTADSVELDPWFADGQLVFSSNAGGRFQIHAGDMRPLTNAPMAAMLPRAGTYLQLAEKGWVTHSYTPVSGRPPPLSEPQVSTVPPTAPPDEPSTVTSDYSMRPSILPNYLAPDLYVDTDNFQFGIATKARDVSRFYAWDAGVRYSPDNEKMSWRLGGQANGFSARATSYSFSYASASGTSVNENRYEMKLAWSPPWMVDLTAGVNWRRYAPDGYEELAEQEWWGSLNYNHSFPNLGTEATLDWFADDSRSLYGEMRYWFGEQITTIARLQVGKTWGDLVPGHNSFRIGGNAREGFFTQRTSRLFPVRGYDTNILDAGQAAALGIEIFWPMARLQRGYRTLPLFLHNIRLGTFLDSGIAAEHPDADDILVGGGVELITGMELAWGIMADFRLGLAWPLRQPEGLDQEGPVFLIQIGLPL